LLAGSIWAHGRALFVQMLAVIFMGGASSSVPMRSDVILAVVVACLHAMRLTIFTFRAEPSAIRKEFKA